MVVRNKGFGQYIMIRSRKIEKVLLPQIQILVHKTIQLRSNIPFTNSSHKISTLKVVF